jgi:hypothetical protein
MLTGKAKEYACNLIYFSCRRTAVVVKGAKYNVV